MKNQIERTEGFFKLPNDVFRIKLDPYAFKVYAYLVCCSGTKGECWPSIPTISKNLGIAKATVQDRLKELEERGFIKKVNNSGLDKNGKPRTYNNHYIVHDFDVPFGAAINRHNEDETLKELTDFD